MLLKSRKKLKISTNKRCTMTIISNKDIIMPQIIEKPFDYSEIFDTTKFPISAECYLSDKDIGW
jgi:hypothetical protein